MNNELEPAAPRAISRWSRRHPPLVAAPTRIAGQSLGFQSPGFWLLGNQVATFATWGIMRSPLPALFKWLCFSVTFGSCLAAGLTTYRRRRRLRLAIERIPSHDLHGAARGQTVRVSGVAQPRGSTFVTPGGRRALVARYLGTIGGVDQAQKGPVHWELHAIDFCVQLDDATSVVVQSEHLVLLPHPPLLPKDLFAGRPVLADDLQVEQRAYAWIHQEEIIAPGDLVDVAGILDHAALPSGSAGSDRQPRLVPVLCGDPRHPVCIRPRLAAANDEHSRLTHLMDHL